MEAVVETFGVPFQANNERGGPGWLASLDPTQPHSPDATDVDRRVIRSPFLFSDENLGEEG